MAFVREPPPPVLQVGGMGGSGSAPPEPESRSEAAARRSGGGAAEAPPRCPQGHTMAASQAQIEGYSKGYSCDRCGGRSSKGHLGGSRRRWQCEQCRHDVCFACAPCSEHVEASARPSKKHPHPPHLAPRVKTLAAMRPSKAAALTCARPEYPLRAGAGVWRRFSCPAQAHSQGGEKGSAARLARDRAPRAAGSRRRQQNASGAPRAEDSRRRQTGAPRAEQSRRRQTGDPRAEKCRRQ